MILAQHGYLGSNLRHLVYDYVVGVGDSIIRSGGGATPGPAPLVAETVRQFVIASQTITNVGSSDLANVTAVGQVGSFWPEFGNTWYARTGHGCIIDDEGVGGSAFNNTTASASWHPVNGSLWAPMVANVNAGLILAGKTKPDLFLTGTGYNDAAQGQTLQYSYLTDFIDAVLAQWPGTRIGIVCGYSNALTTYANLARMYQMRKWFRNLCFQYTTVELIGDMGPLSMWGSCFNVDNIHLNDGGNAFAGSKWAFGATASNSLNKWTRSVLSFEYWRIGATGIAALEALWTALGSQWEKIDCFSVTSTAGLDTLSAGWKNGIQDFTGISVNDALADSTAFFQDGFHALGTADGKRIARAPVSLTANKAVVASDYVWGIYIETNATSAGTQAAIGGSRETAGGAIYLSSMEAASACSYFNVDATATLDPDGSHTTFPSGTWSISKRIGGNKLAFRDQTQLFTSAVAAVAVGTPTAIRTDSLGNYNGNGTISRRYTGTLPMWFRAKGDLDLSIAIPAFNTFWAVWKTGVAIS